MKKIISIIALGLIISACQSGEKSETLQEKIEASIPKTEREPCDLLKAEEVKQVAALSEVELTQNNNYGVCSFSWEVESEKASQEESIANILNAAKSGDASAVASTAQKGYYSVGLNFSTLTPKTKAEALEGYKTILERLNKGITVSKEQIAEKAKDLGLDDKNIEKYASDYTYKDEDRSDIEGIGEAASWSNKTSQLTVVSGTDIFFLTVKASGDKEKALSMAKEIAQLVIKKL